MDIKITIDIPEELTSPDEDENIDVDDNGFEAGDIDFNLNLD